MTLTTSQLDELERKAREASSTDDWHTRPGPVVIMSPLAMAHIAANSPDVTLQLVAIARAALAWSEARRSISYDAPFQRGEAERALAAALRGTP
jgi:hypothetical protein